MKSRFFSKDTAKLQITESDAWAAAFHAIDALTKYAKTDRSASHLLVGTGPEVLIVGSELRK
jgi:hypothetical protein